MAAHTSLNSFARQLHGLATAVRSEVLDPTSLAVQAAEIARRQPSPATRSTYAGVYRAFCAGLGVHVGPDALTAETVRAWRDSPLETRGNACATNWLARYLASKLSI